MCNGGEPAGAGAVSLGTCCCPGDAGSDAAVDAGGDAEALPELNGVTALPAGDRSPAAAVDPE
ncbi:hypothetical protein [Paenarthrobacter histidinolovorans]|uniref:hypothetical protein n=1 Tax=Paenarthrobacter histidinolovorans TaxID=43664 RepID=UPI001E618A3C|nr:hypothetical protein [Paenarthrobacter histidinolovorans]